MSNEMVTVEHFVIASEALLAQNPAVSLAHKQSAQKYLEELIVENSLATVGICLQLIRENSRDDSILCLAAIMLRRAFLNYWRQEDDGKRNLFEHISHIFRTFEA